MSELGRKMIATIRRKAAEHPDFIYPHPPEGQGCKYMQNNLPSCIVGHALWEAGLIKGDIETLPVNQSFFSRLKPMICELESLTSDEACWIRSVQNTQDTGTKTWAQAVAEADKLIPYLSI